MIGFAQMFAEGGEIALLQILFEQGRAPMLAHEINGGTGLPVGRHGFGQGQSAPRRNGLLLGKKRADHRHRLFFRDQGLFGTPTQQVLGWPIGIIGQKAADALKSQLGTLRANGDPFRNHTGNTGPQRRAQSIPFGDIARFIGGNRPFHRLQIGG